jgi:glycosyltransferase involved in cell wall biosynthesis
MKLLLISNMYPSNEDDYYGIFVKNFEKELIKNNVKVKKIVIKGKGKSKLEKLKKYIKFFTDSYKKIKNNDYDLIYVHYINHSLLPLLIFKKFIKKPLIINAHGSDVLVKNKINLIIQKLVMPIIKKANKIIVPSEYFSKIVVNRFKISKERIFVSPSGGIDTNLFKPLKKFKKNEIFTLGYVSRIDEGKGWDILLKAINLIKSDLEFKLIIIGSGKQEKKLKNMIKILKLENYVKFLGSKKHEDLPFYFNQMDVFIFPTVLNESLGLVGLEAMACGIPIIGSKIGGLQDYIIDGKNGYFFEPKNYKDLSQKILTFCNLNESDILKLKKEARETALKYDKNLITKNLINLFERIIKNEKI